jgi:zinc protease
VAMSSRRQATKCFESIGNREWTKIWFTQGELDRAKSEFMASIEKAYNDRTKTNSENFVGEFQANFRKWTALGIEWTFKTFKQSYHWLSLKM